jgi:hypothetical protein
MQTRVMNQPLGPDGRGLRYSSTIDCFAQSVKAEGLLSLWKGACLAVRRSPRHAVCP